MTLSMYSSVEPRVKSFESRLAFFSVPRTMKSAWLTSPESVCPWAEQNGQPLASGGRKPAVTTNAAAIRTPRAKDRTVIGRTPKGDAVPAGRRIGELSGNPPAASKVDPGFNRLFHRSRRRAGRRPGRKPVRLPAAGRDGGRRGTSATARWFAAAQRARGGWRRASRRPCGPGGGGRGRRTRWRRTGPRSGPRAGRRRAFADTRGVGILGIFIVRPAWEFK